MPAGVVALIGVSDVLRLGLSLDRIAAHPGCSLAEARPLGLTDRLLSCLSGLFSGVARPFRRQPQSGGLPEPPLVQIELREWPEARPEPALPLHPTSCKVFAPLWRSLKLSIGASNKPGLGHASPVCFQLRRRRERRNHSTHVRPHWPFILLLRLANRIVSSHVRTHWRLLSR